jgi:DNA-binding protein HU-beta
MNKSELTAAIAQQTGLSQKDCTLALESMIENIKKVLKKGDKVQLVGFGSFEVKKRAARNGVNPQSGEKIKIKARKVPKFNPGKALKDFVK